jgi:hypothetical protein
LIKAAFNYSPSDFRRSYNLARGNESSEYLTSQVFTITSFCI